MIPKIIHYCWFGGKEMPELAKKCLKSWKKYCPDYEIKCWNEETFDINSNTFTKEAYENKKFAFITDYVRLYALYNFGGVYMDTDVQLIKPIDEFLKHRAFSGFESEKIVPTGLMASEKDLSIIKELLDYYTDRHFVKTDGSLNIIPNTQIITKIFISKGLNANGTLQTIDDFTFYPCEYFCPDIKNVKKGIIDSNTHCIHWMAASWVSLKDKIKYKIKMFIRKIIR